MATSFSIHTCSCSLLLIVLLSVVTATKVQLVYEVCHKTNDPPLCLKTLSGSKYQNVTFEALVAHAFEEAQLTAIGCDSEFEKLLSSPKQPDPKTKTLISQCKKLYDQILVIQLRPAHKAADAKQWDNVTEKVTPVPREVVECETLFHNNSPVHEESKIVRVAAEAILFLAGIVNR